MMGIRLAALVLFANAGVALAQNEPPQSKPLPQPCGAPIYNNEFFFVDAAGESTSFCVRQRHSLRPNGGHRLLAAVQGSRYCTVAKPFDDIENCHFSGIVWCNQKLSEFLITFRFFNCQKVFGRKNFTRRRIPLADVLAPPGLSSVAGAFVSS